MSAFLKYSQTRRALVKQQNPDMSNTDVSRLLGEMWRTASSKEKAPYVEQEQLERQAYKDEMMRWKAQQARLDAASRTSHQEMEESRTDMGSRQSSTTVRMPPVVAPTYYGNYPQYHRYPPQYDVRQQYPMAYQTQQSFAEGAWVVGFTFCDCVECIPHALIPAQLHHLIPLSKACTNMASGILGTMRTVIHLIER
jgi:hypothetical protein